MTAKTIVIALYALVILAAGVAGMRKTRSFSDFFLGGGNIGPWMTAFTYGTAYFSAVLFIGFAGKIGWGFGYSGIWIAFGNAVVGVLGVWALLGWRVKKMSQELEVATMAEFFEARYGGRLLKLLASMSIFVFFIPYSAAVFMGLSYLFKSNFSIDYITALAFMGVFTAMYLAMGGYRSMTLIDMVFGIIMIAGVAVLVSSSVNRGGGLDSITASLASIDPRLVAPVGPPGLWPLFCLVFLTSVAPFGMPQLVQKFYAIRDRRAVRIGMVASTFFAVIIGFAAYFTGAITRVLLSPETAPGAFSETGEPVFDALMPELLANVIPGPLSVLILLLILSASISTLAALVLISSSAVTKDFYAGFVNRNAGDKQLTLLMRISSVFFVTLSVILAYFKPATIVAILAISWGAIGSVFLGPFLWGLFSSRVNRTGALCSSVLGLGTCLVMYGLGRPTPEAGTVGMLVSLTVNPVASRLSDFGASMRKKNHGE